jgi:predicted nucleic acid-binding Zn ribbon protein
MPRPSNLIRLGDAIKELFRQEKIDERMSQYAVKSSWKDIAGEFIASSTTDISFNNRTIFLTIKNSALKQEVSFRKEELLNNVNKFCGYALIDKIVIL